MGHTEPFGPGTPYWPGYRPGTEIDTCGGHLDGSDASQFGQRLHTPLSPPHAPSPQIPPSPPPPPRLHTPRTCTVRMLASLVSASSIEKMESLMSMLTKRTNFGVSRVKPTIAWPRGEGGVGGGS